MPENERTLTMRILEIVDPCHGFDERAGEFEDRLNEVEASAWRGREPALAGLTDNVR